MAATPNTAINNWLNDRLGRPNNRFVIRKHLDYLLDVLRDCRSNDFSEVFDEKRVDPNVYNAIMMGIGSVAMRRFNILFRKSRFTSLKTGGVREPIQQVDKAAGLALFDKIVDEVEGS